MKKFRIFKKNLKILSTFFQVDQIDFQSFAKAQKDPVLIIFLHCERKFEKQAKKSVVGTFWKYFAKITSQFLASVPTSKLVYCGAKGALTNFLGSAQIVSD